MVVTFVLQLAEQPTALCMLGAAALARLSDSLIDPQPPFFTPDLIPKTPPSPHLTPSPPLRLKEEGLLCMRPWHDEVIMVMAPPKPPMRCFYNSIIRETLSSNDQSRVSWTGNLLCLSSSLQSEICPDLGGLTRYALNGLLQVCCGGVGTLKRSGRQVDWAGSSCCTSLFCFRQQVSTLLRVILAARN